jgi:hypothetical protein
MFPHQAPDRESAIIAIETRLEILAGQRHAFALQLSGLYPLLRHLAQNGMLAANFYDLEILDVGLIVAPADMQNLAHLVIRHPCSALLTVFHLAGQRCTSRLEGLTHRIFAGLFATVSVAPDRFLLLAKEHHGGGLTGLRQVQIGYRVALLVGDLGRASRDMELARCKKSASWSFPLGCRGPVKPH